MPGRKRRSRVLSAAVRTDSMVQDSHGKWRCCVTLLRSSAEMPTVPQVVVPLPDEAGRAAILAVHMRGVPLAHELDPAAVCELISKMTRGACMHIQCLYQGIRSLFNQRSVCELFRS